MLPEGAIAPLEKGRDPGGELARMRSEYKAVQIQWCCDVSSRRGSRFEIDTLMQKSVKESQQGFYSHYFLILKKRGSVLRPILNLHVLNSHLRRYTEC